MATLKDAKAIIKNSVQTALDMLDRKGTVEMNDRIIPVLVGDPGLGKSAIVREAAKELGIDFTQTNLVDRDAADLAGLPFVQGEDMIRLRPNYLPKPGSFNPATGGKFGEKGLFFWDEIAQAPIGNLNVAARAFSEHVVGEHVIDPGWVHVGAMNKASNKAGTNRLPTHLRDRILQIEVEVDVDGWLEYAMKKGVDPMVLGFVKFKPDQLHRFDPDAQSCPTPRSWEKVSTALQNFKLSGGQEHIVVAGLVGVGAATDFMGFVKLARSLPDPMTIMANPETSEIPEKKDVLYALVSALAYRVNKTTVENFCKYITRLPGEYGVFAAAAAMRRDTSLLKTKAMVDYRVKHAAKLAI